MKKLLTTLLSLTCLQTMPFMTLAQSVNERILESDERKVLIGEAKTQIMSLGSSLTTVLKQGIKVDGHAASIKLCKLQAPAITRASSAESGASDWTVSRSSLKLRNPSNSAEIWVTAIMQDFEKRKAAGELAKDIAHTEVRDGKFYFVKAIPTKPGCIACHGENIAEDVKVKLAELYPNDKATGFNVGDIRGVFIASKEIK
jgi:hypothetical protein